MTDATDTSLPPCDLAIIGGGAGGVLAALQALRRATTPLRIVMIEPRDVLAQGVAYATTYGEHVLNVPAGRMSAFDDRPADFLDYVVATTPPGGPDRETLAHAFIERRRYGDYLRTRLQEVIAASPASLQVVHDTVAELDARDDGTTLHLVEHGTLDARGVVLAVGNTPKPLPARGAPHLPEGRSLAAWDFDAVKAIPADAELCIIGSGLSMVDTVLSLADNSHAGTIHVLSRHALAAVAALPWRCRDVRSRAVAGDGPARAHALPAQRRPAGGRRWPALAGRDGAHPPARADTVAVDVAA